MRTTLRVALLGILALSLAFVAMPAGADPEGDHPGSGAGDPGSHEKMQHLANVPRSSDQFQSDLAFVGKYAFAGNYNGFRIIDVSAPARPRVVKDVWCPGPQNDISVWGDLVILSVDSVMVNDRCGSPVSPNLHQGWEGIRIFSLSEVLSTPAQPNGFTVVQPVATAYTDCGSHTHTGYPQGDTLYVYISSYPLRGGPGCGPNNPQGENPLHEKISIVEVPVSNPTALEVHEVPIDIPTFNQDPMFLPPPAFNPMRGCHDIQVHVGLELAAAACSSVGQVWDISDPLNPTTLDPLWEVDEPEVQFYHSALFSEDAETVIFGDEIITGANCDDGSGAGQMWFYDMDGTLLSSHQTPRHQGGAYCTAHLFNNIPTNRGNVLVASWYAAGTAVIDYTDPSNPREIAHFDPANTDTLRTSTWASYWYNGFVYANDGTGPRLECSVAGAKKVQVLNPQTQY